MIIFIQNTLDYLHNTDKQVLEELLKQGEVRKINDIHYLVLIDNKTINN
jgi:hypothetical protein